MKKSIRLNTLTMAAGLILVSTALPAQVNTNSIFTENELVWYGLDFTEAKFVGKFDQGFDTDPVSANELVFKYVPAWNQLVLDEPMNFNLGATFRKPRIYYDIKPVTQLNAKIKTEALVTYNANVIMKDHLGAMVSAYPEGDKKEGLGLVFIVENFDKSNRKGNYWIVFFDIKSRKVLFSDYCSGAPVGFGMRNYWAGSLKHVLNEVRFFRFDMWKKNILRESKQLVSK